ncbi:hypothetical protein [Pseudofrankia asymbiotica]|uniref:hypothetical protein n=1 Tax=Pseudofrankia asymbiotica TaxID=1834516 RepID=UPI001304261A|nr:hypothetical protein [Pseudofrankia asymbiotica]
MRAAAGSALAPRPGSSRFTSGGVEMFSAVCAIELGDGSAADQHPGRRSASSTGLP